MKALYHIANIVRLWAWGRLSHVERAEVVREQRGTSV